MKSLIIAALSLHGTTENIVRDIIIKYFNNDTLHTILLKARILYAPDKTGTRTIIREVQI